MERHLEENNMTAEKQQFNLFPKLNNNLYSVLSFQESENNIKAGIHLLMEEDMPESEISIQNFFMYSFGFMYTKNSFNVAFNIENFMNLFNNNFSIEPAVHDNNMVYLEHDVSSLISVSINYIF
jgi:hypothetical protein